MATDTATAMAKIFVRRYGETWEGWDIDGFLALFSDQIAYVAHPDEVVEGTVALRHYSRRRG